MNYSKIVALLCAPILVLGGGRGRLIRYDQKEHETAIKQLLLQERPRIFLNDDRLEAAEKLVCEKINSGEYKTRVRIKNGQFIGFISYAYKHKSGLINLLAVQPEYRRKKHGTHWLRTIVKKMKENGVTRIYLAVRPDNEAALNLYKKYGFKITRQSEKVAHMLRKE